MTQPTPQQCLIQILEIFEKERGYLTRAYNHACEKSVEESTTLTSEIKNRQDVMEALYTDVLSTSGMTLYSQNKKGQINSMTPDTASKALGEIHKILEGALQAKTDVGRENKAKLAHHVESDRWYFHLLAKLINAVCRGLGLKTSSEKTLDSAVSISSPFKPS